jgi:hypothetical protein
MKSVNNFKFLLLTRSHYSKYPGPDIWASDRFYLRTNTLFFDWIVVLKLHDKKTNIRALKWIKFAWSIHISVPWSFGLDDILDWLRFLLHFKGPDQVEVFLFGFPRSSLPNFSPMFVNNSYLGSFKPWNLNSHEKSWEHRHLWLKTGQSRYLWLVICNLQVRTNMNSK